ncbi:hypothetical protein C3L33_17556, partial [Rhododendron williamsianum]
MDSEDDMHDGNDAESTDDDHYSGNRAVEYSEDDKDGDDDGHYEFDNESDEVSASRRQQNYIGLKEADIRQHQEDEITTVSTVLSVSRADAAILLRHHRWSASNVHDCAEEAHRPVDCGTVAKWVMKNSANRKTRIGF